MDGWLTPDPESSQAKKAPTPEAAQQLMIQSLSAAIRPLQQAGKQVIVLEDTPYFDFDPLLRVRNAQIPPRHALAEWLQSPLAGDPGLAAPANAPGIARAAEALHQTAAANPGVQLIALQPALCPTPAQCAYRQGATLLFLDNSHLSAAGASYILRDFRLPPLEPPLK
jgi:hypothetical protein